MIKTLFLEIDGVLHPWPCQLAESFRPEQTLHEILSISDQKDPPLWLCHMPKFEDVLRGTYCQIIISSDLRFLMPVEVILSWFPRSIQPMVVGTTGARSKNLYHKSAEIRDYLSRRGKLSWRALDCSRRGYATNCPELIFCNPLIGIEPPQIEKLRAWLRES